MHDPARTGAAEPGEVEPAPAEALGDVARVVDADEEERNSARTGAVEGGQAVADLLEAGAESALQDLDVVAQGPGRVEEPAIRHDDAAGEVVGECEAAEAPGLRTRELRPFHVAVEQFAPRVEGDLDGELEAARRRREQFGEKHAPAVEVVAARGLGHDVDREHAHLDSVNLAQMAAEAAKHVRRIQLGFGP